MGLTLGNSLKQPSYTITGVENKLYDLDQLSDLKNRVSDGPLALQYESELKKLVDKVYYEVSVLASSRALYEINLRINQEYEFPDPTSIEYLTFLNKYTNENFIALYQKAFNTLVEEVVSDTDKDGMLLYLKERGFHIYSDDIKKYLLGDRSVHTTDFSAALEFISNTNNSVVNQSGIFVKEGNALFAELFPEVMENVPDIPESEE